MERSGDARTIDGVVIGVPRDSLFYLLRAIEVSGLRKPSRELLEASLATNGSDLVDHQVGEGAGDQTHYDMRVGCGGLSAQILVLERDIVVATELSQRRGALRVSEAEKVARFVSTARLGSSTT